MFQKLIGKRKKQSDVFHIPQKKYTTDQKIISKMGTGALKDLFNDQEKYVSTLIEKLEHAKTEYDRLTDKVDELQEKNEVVNGQIARMTNEHEELTIKFDNLQISLEIVSSENDLTFKKELTFLNDQEVNCDKIKNLNAVLTFYREKTTLCKKIEQQNRSLKARYSEMEESLEEAQSKIQEFEKEKNYNNLIPSLMQEIQTLRENSARAESKKQEDLQNHLSKLEEKLVHKVKNELQSVSTLKTAEEEEEQEKYKSNSIQLQKLKGELQSNQQKLKEIELKCQDLIFNCGKSSEKILTLQSELNKSKEIISQYQNKITEVSNKLKEAEQKLAKQITRNKQLEQQLSEQKSSGNNIQDFLAQINTVLESKQAQCSQLHEELQHKQQIILSKQQQLTRQKQNREGIQKLLSNKNNNEMEGLLKIKSKNEAEIQELRQTIDSLKRAITENQNKLKQISDELQLLKSTNQNLTQQKKMIQENANNCLKISQEESWKMKSLQKQLINKIDELKKEAESAAFKIKQRQDQVKNLTTETQKLFKTLQSKEAELKKNYAYIQQLQKDKTNVNMIIGEKQEDNKIRIRKYESQLNQERIKLQSLNRKINNLEAKAQESKVSMDSMYEQLLSKDKKIVHMETKLKQYKYIIQVQKKEKQQLEESYEKAISNFKPAQSHKVEHAEDEKKVKQAVEKQVDHEKENLANELLSIKEQNIVLLSQNEGLRRKIEQLQDTIHEKSRNIKILQQKRDSIMKEIEKMNKKTINPNEHVNLTSLPSPTVMRMDSKEHENREKKIAAKAHKGFDILLKLQHQFYKNFINIFAVELNRQQVKGIQGEINTIIKKSNDMKDIFEDYL